MLHGAGLKPYAWRQCPRGDWLLWLCVKLDFDTHSLISIACDCVDYDVSVVRRWLAGNITTRNVEDLWGGDSYLGWAIYANVFWICNAVEDYDCAAHIRARLPWRVVKAALLKRGIVL